MCMIPCIGSLKDEPSKCVQNSPPPCGTFWSDKPLALDKTIRAGNNDRKLILKLPVVRSIRAINVGGPERALEVGNAGRVEATSCWGGTRIALDIGVDGAAAGDGIAHRCALRRVVGVQVDVPKISSSLSRAGSVAKGRLVAGRRDYGCCNGKALRGVSNPRLPNLGRHRKVLLGKQDCFGKLAACRGGLEGLFPSVWPHK